MASHLWFVPHPEAWRYRAALTRLSAKFRTDVNKDHELRLAELFERLARYAEERVAAERATRRALPAPPARRLIAGPKEEDGVQNGSSTGNLRSGFWRD
jgi:hypothetical protein